MERYVATSARGEQVVRTNNLEEAQEWAYRLRGQVIDLQSQAVAS